MKPETKKENNMMEPKFERTEIAGCVGCIGATILIIGASFEYSFVNYPCGTTWAGICT